MPRNSRFRTTSGPTSNRPRTDRKKPGKSADKPFRNREEDRTSSFGKKKPFRNYEEDRSSSFGKKKSFRNREEGKTSSFGNKRPFRKEGHGGEKESRRKGPGDFARGDKPTFAKRRFSDNRSESSQGERSSQRPFYKTGFGRSKEQGAPDRFKARGDKGDFRRGGKSSEEGRTWRKGGSSDKGKSFSSRPYEGRLGDERPERKERKSFIESRIDRQRKSTLPHQRHAEKKEEKGDGLIRLNKFIANSGVCSRREADNLITMGLITVNGKSVTELGFKVKPSDDVRYEGRRLNAEPMVYILLNKPKGFITTTDDPQERNTVMKLIEGACKERVYPVGRLDRNTSGLLLLTNDGDLTDKLTHPSYNVKKIYKAELDKPLTKADFQKIRDGVRLEEGVAQVDDLAVISEDGKTIGIEIHIGWNRVIRRIFEVLGYEVVKLDRSVYASLDKKDLSRGHWRFLRQDEVIRLKHFQ